MRPIEFQHKSASAKVQMISNELGALIRVYSKIRNAGEGAELMRSVTTWADINNVTLILTAQGYGPRGILTNEQLVQFYGNHGFRIDERYSGLPRRMVRPASQDLQAP